MGRGGGWQEEGRKERCGTCVRCGCWKPKNALCAALWDPQTQCTQIQKHTRAHTNTHTNSHTTLTVTGDGKRASSQLRSTNNIHVNGMKLVVSCTVAQTGFLLRAKYLWTAS